MRDEKQEGVVPKKRTRVTFDTLEEDKSLDLSLKAKEAPPETSSELVNRQYWNNEKFSQIFYQRKNKFSSDQNELKNEFSLWHNELGNRYYDPIKKCFTIDQIPFKNKKYIFYDLNIFLTIHPWLTARDEKQLSLINKEIKNKFKNLMILNFFGGLTIGYFFLNKRSKQLNVSYQTITRKYFVNCILIFAISCLYVDSRFKLKKASYMIQLLDEKGLTQRYFKNYLT